MGEKLMLPAKYEKYRKELENSLTPIEVKELEI
jgi:glyoxalase family protein